MRKTIFALIALAVSIASLAFSSWSLGYSEGVRDSKTVCMEAPAQPPTQSKRLFPNGAKGALK